MTTGKIALIILGVLLVVGLVQLDAPTEAPPRAAACIDIDAIAGYAEAATAELRQGTDAARRYDLDAMSAHLREAASYTRLSAGETGTMLPTTTALLNQAADHFDSAASHVDALAIVEATGEVEAATQAIDDATADVVAADAAGDLNPC